MGTNHVAGLADGVELLLAIIIGVSEAVNEADKYTVQLNRKLG